MNAATRKKQVGWLEKGDDQPHILTNARCLTEGIDVPSLDAIVFADPRRSQIDIVQAVGRVMRTNPDSSNKVGRIIIPLVVPNEEDIDGDDVFKDSTFKPVWDVIRALKAHDFRLEAGLNRLRRLSALGPVSQEEFEEVTRLRVIGINALEAFHLRIIERSTSNFWWWLNGPMKQFVEREGHALPSAKYVETFLGEDVNLGKWVSHLRNNFKNGMLTASQIEYLENLSGWEWDYLEASWIRNMSTLRNFVNQQGHSRPKAKHVETIGGETFNLGNFVLRCRQKFVQGKLSDERISELEALPGWAWNRDDFSYQQHFEALLQYAEREGHTRPKNKHKEPFNGEELNLGSWVSEQRKNFTEGKLSDERISELEALPGWAWNRDDFSYQQHFEALLQYAERKGHTRVRESTVEPFQNEDLKLGDWVGRKKKEYKNGSLTQKEVAEFEALPGWEWSLRKFDYDQNIGALKQYVTREGHARPVAKQVERFEGVEINLGAWVATNRGEYKLGNLSDEKIADLESFSGWVWDPLADSWLSNIGALKQFIAREGHARPARGFIETFEGKDVNLGRWARYLRERFKKGKLSTEKIADLEALPGWEWSVK